MANMFDENGNYNKTEWKPGDRITAGKLNKIEESLEAINNNDIERHKEADERLDALEEQKEAVEERFDELEDLVADNKSEVDTAIYEVHSKMDRLEQEMNDGIDEVHNVAETVDGKIAEVNEVADEMEGLLNETKAFTTNVKTEIGTATANAKTEIGTATENGLTELEDLIKVFDMEEVYKKVDGSLDDMETMVAEVESELEETHNKTCSFVNIMEFGAKMNDETFMNDSVFAEALKYCAENKKKLILPRGTFYISEPIILNGVDIEGYVTTITIRNDNAPYVMYGESLNNFKLTGLHLVGNRKNYSEGNAVTTDGLYLKGCSYITVEECRFIDCSNGFRGYGTYCGEIRRCTAVRSQSYAFHCTNSCTSLKFDTCVAWGCGGGFRFTSSVYMTIINPANDHNSAGGYAKDPWLPQGSGGNYLNPSPIYHFTGTQVSIISSGTENAFSPLIYMEGSNVVMTNPYFWKSDCYAETFRFINIVGDKSSSLDIFNPTFTDITNHKGVYYTRTGISVERPEIQKVRSNVYFSVSDAFGEYDMYNKDAMSVNNSKYIYDFSEYTLFENQIIPFISSLEDRVTVIKKTDRNVINIPSVKGAYYLPLPSGVLRFKTVGYYASSKEVANLSIISKDSNGNEIVLHGFQNNGEMIDHDTLLKLPAQTGIKYYFKVNQTYNGNTIQFSRLLVVAIGM